MTASESHEQCHTGRHYRHSECNTPELKNCSAGTTIAVLHTFGLGNRSTGRRLQFLHTQYSFDSAVLGLLMQPVAEKLVTLEEVSSWPSKASSKVKERDLWR